MNSTQYLTKLMSIKKELDVLRNEFCKLNPHTDWTKVRIDHIVGHSNCLTTIIQPSPLAINKKLVDADVNYFKENANCIRIVFKSEQNFKRSINEVHK